MPLQILINEIHPNPETGNEWVELLASEPLADNFSLANYSISDSYHQIYKFSDEQFSNQLLVVEVSGLNNDQDSVVLKDPNDNILDYFAYTQTQKGLSWSLQFGTNDFILSEASRNLPNPTLTPVFTPTPTSIITLTPSVTITVTPTSTPTSTLTLTPTLTPTSAPGSATLSAFPTTANTASAIRHHYDLSKIKLQSNDKTFTERQTRLVLLSKIEGKIEILNAIIGSSLIILGSAFLLYVRIKNKHR